MTKLALFHSVTIKAAMKDIQRSANILHEDRILEMNFVFTFTNIQKDENIDNITILTQIIWRLRVKMT